MRRALTNIARTGLRVLATLRSALPTEPGARIITYHSVQPVGSGPRSSYVDPGAFDAHISWLLRSGRKVVPLSLLAERVASRQPIPADWTCITFDDGYVDNYRYAFPVLKHYEVPATIFLVTGKINKDPDFLTLAQIAEMQGYGVTFGAHTVDHVSLSSIPPEEALRQIQGSAEQLEALTGHRAEHFCYPFGHYNETVEGFVRASGFQTCCTEQAGPVTSKSDLLRLRRAGILGTDSLRDFALKVQGAYDWWINAYMKLEERRRQRGG